jgi:hypothetical protein
MKTAIKYKVTIKGKILYTYDFEEIEQAQRLLGRENVKWTTVAKY